MYGMQEVESIDREVRESLKDIEEQISRAESGQLPERDLDRLNDKIKQTGGRIKTMEMELRQVKNRETARKFKPVVREHQKKIREFETQLQWSQAGKSSQNQQYTADDIAKNENVAIAYGRELQDRTDAAADRAIDTLAQTHETATATAEKVHEQGKQIERIGEHLDEVDAEIDRATRVLKRISRRVMTDKYIWCLISLIFIGIVAVIILLVVNGDVNSSDVNL